MFGDKAENSHAQLNAFYNLSPLPSVPYVPHTSYYSYHVSFLRCCGCFHLHLEWVENDGGRGNCLGTWSERAHKPPGSPHIISSSLQFPVKCPRIRLTRNRPREVNYASLSSFLLVRLPGLSLPTGQTCRWQDGRETETAMTHCRVVLLSCFSCYSSCCVLLLLFHVVCVIIYKK